MEALLARGERGFSSSPLRTTRLGAAWDSGSLTGDMPCELWGFSSSPFRTTRLGAAWDSGSSIGAMLGELWGELLGEFLAARRAAADGIGARVPLCGGEGRAGARSSERSEGASLKGLKG